MTTHVVAVEDDQSVREILAAVLRAERYEFGVFGVFGVFGETMTTCSSVSGPLPCSSAGPVSPT